MSNLELMLHTLSALDKPRLHESNQAQWAMEDRMAKLPAKLAVIDKRYPMLAQNFREYAAENAPRPWPKFGEDWR